jgi:hypothetical protein
VIRINGRIATAKELEVILQQLPLESYETIIRAMLAAAPMETLQALQTAIDTLKSERQPSDPNTNH